MNRKILPTFTTQSELRQKFNQYLTHKKGPLFTTGICHGISLVWLRHMVDETDKNFLSLLTKLLEHPADEMENFPDEVALEKLIAKIRFAQEPHEYITNPVINQNDIQKILETDNYFHFFSYQNKKRLTTLLQEMSEHNNSMLLYSRNACPHSIAVFRRTEGYYVFDSNKIELNPMPIPAPEKIIDELLQGFHEAFDIKRTQWVQLGFIAINQEGKCHDQQAPYSASTMAFFSPLVNSDPMETLSPIVNTNLGLK